MSTEIENEEIVAQEEYEEVSLNIDDIANALAVIDYACTQGAFKGWDTIEKVRFVRNKLDSFVKFARANSPVVEETPAAAE